MINRCVLTITILMFFNCFYCTSKSYSKAIQWTDSDYSNDFRKRSINIEERKVLAKILTRDLDVRAIRDYQKKSVLNKNRTQEKFITEKSHLKELEEIRHETKIYEISTTIIQNIISLLLLVSFITGIYLLFNYFDKKLQYSDEK